ncbi:hypothetical protein D9757_013626 [Collybiopsis confluens]|uniref:Uncharacterized protein n=1 Tax=Collybiopsis confluens TaxID=2823264 RepID=A0A8H5D089_9AGAR|nr:hypothetical protein D9757_013626 [Collybiopsis confluens]
MRNSNVQHASKMQKTNTKRRTGSFGVELGHNIVKPRRATNDDSDDDESDDEKVVDMSSRTRGDSECANNEDSTQTQKTLEMGFEQ